MARKVEEFPAHIGQGAPPKYPWDEWLDGNAWELVPDDDFPGLEVQSFRQQLSRAAKDRAKFVATVQINGSLFVQARDRS